MVDLAESIVTVETSLTLPTSPSVIVRKVVPIAGLRPMAVVALLAVSFGVVYDCPAMAQIAPDASLGAEPSQWQAGNVVVNGQVSDRISGGAQRNSLLFHSFREFNIGTNQRVYFANPVGVNHIFARVTGGNPSTLLGTLGVLGNASLLLLNPNGILFGPNARLDLRGAFTASTGTSLLFDNGFAFSSANPQAPPLLTIQAPIGIQWGSGAAPITNQSRAVDAAGNPVGLQVDPGQGLQMLGGDLQLAGGILTAANGAIELGSVAANSRLSLAPSTTGFVPVYPPDTTFQDIALTQQASVNASGLGGGQIQVVGRNVSLSDRSAILADTLGALNGQGITILADRLNLASGAFISASTLGSGHGGDLELQIRNAIELTGQGYQRLEQQYAIGAFLGLVTPLTRENGIFSHTAGSGNAGSVQIATQQLILREGSTILSYVFGQGNGAMFDIRATDINVNGGLISTSLLPNGIGNAGDITLKGDRLLLQHGGILSNGTLGQGNGGNLSIHMREWVMLQKNQPQSLFSTAITTSALGSGAGNSGNLTIQTQQLLVRDGAGIGSNTGAAQLALPVGSGKAGDLTIQASDLVEVSGASPDGVYLSRILSETYNQSPAGALRIDTRRLVVQDGGQISSATFGAGAGGPVMVNASEAISVRGTSPDGRTPSGLLASSGSALFPNTRGASGSLQLTTADLTVADGGTLTVSSVGQSDAGRLQIRANRVRLDMGGRLSASTASGEGGDIRLEVRDVLQLRRHSLISATAGGNGNGGNIDITAGFIVANALENSDIIANASGGRGGRITLTAQGIFGLVFRPALTRLSDITASSGIGLDGIVILNVPNLDPLRGATSLPSGLVDTAKLIATSCLARSAQQAESRFTIVGGGGLSLHPEHLMETPFQLADSPEHAKNRLLPPAIAPPAPTHGDPAMEEIDSIYQHPDGTIHLTRDCR
jgi:filamentous hemagglutinin family protein